MVEVIKQTPPSVVFYVQILASNQLRFLPSCIHWIPLEQFNKNVSELSEASLRLDPCKSDR